MKRTPKAGDVDIKFSQWPPVTLQFIGDFENSIQFLGGPVGTGKCFSPGTRVIMYDGSLKAVEDVVVGDRLLGPDGLPRKVITISTGVGKMWRVRQFGGIPYTVNEGHPLVTVNRRMCISHPPVEELKGGVLSNLRGFRQGIIKPRKVFEGDIKRYTVGAWKTDNAGAIEALLFVGQDERVQAVGALISCARIIGRTGSDTIIGRRVSFMEACKRLVQFCGMTIFDTGLIGSDIGVVYSFKVIAAIQPCGFPGANCTMASEYYRPLTVEPIGMGEYYGFMVGNRHAEYPHHFMLEDMTVVHNTYSAAAKLLMMALHIKPRPDGWRRSRWIVARRNYGDLEASIVKDFEESIAKGMFFSSGKTSPMFGRIFLDTPDLKVDAEIYFYAFENDEAAKKIKSLKFTGGMVVEAQEFESHLTLRRIYERLGRYPTPEDADEIPDDELDSNPEIEFQFPGGNYRGRFMFGDINYTGMGWLYDYLVTNNRTLADGRKQRKLYEQPPIFTFLPKAVAAEMGGKAMEGNYKGEDGAWVRNPDALPYIKFNGWGYWEDIIRENYGQDGEITRNVMGKFYRGTGGKPVHPSFREEFHVADRELGYTRGLLVSVGVDNGFNNAWIHMQMVGDMIYVIDEICNVAELAKSVKDAVQDDIIPYNGKHLHGFRVKYVLDQAFFSKEGGEGKAQVDQLTDNNLEVMPCPEKFTTAIRSLVGRAFRERRVLISPRCKMLINGLDGGYSYPFNPSSGQHSETPDKNSPYSHIVEAFEFGVVSYMSNGYGKVQNAPPGGRKKKKKYSYL